MLSMLHQTENYTVWRAYDTTNHRDVVIKTITPGVHRLKRALQGLEREVKEAIIQRQCDREYVEQMAELAEGCDAILSMGCGVGVNYSTEVLKSIRVLPALNTRFFGANVDEGVWSERCQGCVQCILAKTGAICPVSRCAKRLFNGPCGGSTKGKCEISKDLDCAWQVIIDRLKELDRLADYETITPIKDWSTERAGGPRKVVREDLQQ